MRSLHRLSHTAAVGFGSSSTTATAAQLTTVVPRAMDVLVAAHQRNPAEETVSGSRAARIRDAWSVC